MATRGDDKRKRMEGPHGPGPVRVGETGAAWWQYGRTRLMWDLDEGRLMADNVTPATYAMLRSTWYVHARLAERWRFVHYLATSTIVCAVANFAALAGRVVGPVLSLVSIWLSACAVVLFAITVAGHRRDVRWIDKRYGAPD